MKTLFLLAYLMFVSGSVYAYSSAMVEVPAGEFVMGNNTDDYALPKKALQLEAFSIDRFEVTHEKFARLF